MTYIVQICVDIFAEAVTIVTTLLWPGAESRKWSLPTVCLEVILLSFLHPFSSPLPKKTTINIISSNKIAFAYTYRELWHSYFPKTSQIMIRRIFWHISCNNQEAERLVWLLPNLSKDKLKSSHLTPCPLMTLPCSKVGHVASWVQCNFIPNHTRSPRTLLHSATAHLGDKRKSSYYLQSKLNCIMSI